MCVIASATSRVVISPSLVALIAPSKKTPRDVSLGMSDWTDSNCEDSSKENQPCSDDDFKHATHPKKI